MDLKESWGFWYWIAMVPIFGGLSVYLEWNTQVHAANPKPLHLKAQLVHWLATLLGVGLVFLMEDRRIEFDRTETGLMSLLVLGLSTVLLGVHTQWRLAVVGLLLLVTLVAAMAAEQFFWLMLIPTAIALWVMHRRQK
ncbi:hypothetical protein DRQ53_14235 [bacterium]|nr:MAG: hypothetical protein DRQ53_14235 [bacterium]